MVVSPDGESQAPPRPASPLGGTPGVARRATARREPKSQAPPRPAFAPGVTPDEPSGPRPRREPKSRAPRRPASPLGVTPRVAPAPQRVTLHHSRASAMRVAKGLAESRSVAPSGSTAQA